MSSAPALALVPPAPPAGERKPIDDLLAWIRTHFGLSFTGDQRGLIESRIGSFCGTVGHTVPSLLHQLVVLQDRALTLKLAEAVSTNHTFFFRESELFDLLAKEILPSIAARPIRIWSAAASSGDEAYSIAILANEVLGDAAQADVRILGTDLSERQLKTAEQAIYPAQQVASVSAARRHKWFQPAGLGQLAIRPEARRMCTFRRMNLTTQPWPFEQRFHVIFLRNVLYYFEPVTRRQVVEACYDAAEPGAWLITSLTEPMLDLTTRWSAIRPAVFRKAVS
jgi:chemotaxis protein methyltransferase CheR